jgi:tRNA-2-methylthio-N6-dimethylallyladenosine synthase
LTEIINLQGEHCIKFGEAKLGKVVKVLVEGVSKRSIEEFYGRDEQASTVIFPKGEAKPGQYAMVKIGKATRASLRGEIVSICEPHPIQKIEL